MTGCSLPVCCCSGRLLHIQGWKRRPESNHTGGEAACCFSSLGLAIPAHVLCVDEALTEANMPQQALKRWGNWGQIAPGVSNGQSEIKFTKLEFARPASIAAQFDPEEGATGLIQAVLFEVNDRNLIGYPTSTGYRYCCTKELVPKTKCHKDRLIYQVCYDSIRGDATRQTHPNFAWRGSQVSTS